MSQENFSSIPLSSVFEAASLVSIITTDTAGIITLFNSGAENLLGYKAAEVVGKHTPELFHLQAEVEAAGRERSRITGKTVEGFGVFIDQSLNHKHREQEWTYVTRTGEHKKVLLAVTPVRHEDGTLIGYLGVATDITKRKNAEQELEAQKRLMQIAIDNIPQFIFWKDTNSVYLGCNLNFAKAAGVENSAAIRGKTDYDLPWKKEEAEFFRQCDRRVMDSLTPEYHIIETQLQADGKEALVDTNKIPMLDENNNLIGMIGTYEDITERLQVERELSQSEENLRITLKAIGDGVIVTNTKGLITRLNPVAEKLTGWAMQDASGKRLEEVFAVYDKRDHRPIESPVELVLRSKDITPLPKPALLITVSEERFDISASGAPIITREGETVGVVIVFRDITEEVRVQEQLNQSQKLEAVGRLASGIAHDFNNMLGGIMGSAELLRNYITDDPKGEKYISLLLNSAQRAAELAKKLLAFSKQNSINSTPIDIHNVIGETVALLANTLDKKIEIETDLSAATSTIIGDNSQLQNVFLNLGINASHAMPDGGTLCFATSIIHLSETFCKANTFDIEPGSYLQIAVRDTGCGISQAMLLRIFDPFFTTKGTGKGTGLGLAVAYGTIKQHRGAITVYSEEDAGTCFYIYLPLTSETASKIQELILPVPGEGLILLIDDEHVMRVTGEAMLKEFGYDVLVANNGMKGLELFKKHAGEIDLVIMDMIMPQMNGRECFYEIKKVAPDTPVILSSGFSRDEDVQDLKAKGLAGFVKKPFGSVELSQTIAAAIKGRKTSPEKKP